MSPYTRRKKQLKNRILRKKNRLSFLRDLTLQRESLPIPPSNLVEVGTWEQVDHLIGQYQKEISNLSSDLAKHLKPGERRHE